jgi:DNA-binding winged helix-turn-helix (wHTH) protein
MHGFYTPCRDSETGVVNGCSATARKTAALSRSISQSCSRIYQENVKPVLECPQQRARGALRSMRLIYRFYPYQVDVCAGELRKHGLRLKLAPQLGQILAMLLERHGEIVTREDLKVRLWPGEPPSDFELSLNKAMNKLRQVLSDKADKPRFIETLPRQGYRFIARIDAAPDHSASVALQSASAD